MKVSLKVVITLAVSIIAMLAIGAINNAEREYNIGLLVIIIIACTIAGVITIWSSYTANPATKTIN
jgi:hypothetical protein